MVGSDDSASLTIAVIGGSGRICTPFVRHFLGAGAQTRVLTRTPEHVRAATPRAEPIADSMMRTADVTRTLKGADAAVLLTGNKPRAPFLHKGRSHRRRYSR